MDKLYSLLQSYSDKDIDDQFINDAFDIMIGRESELGEFVKSFSIREIGYNAVAGYSRETGSIIVDSNLLKAQTGEIAKVVALKTVRQQIERARNLKTSIEGTERIEPIILRCANRDFLLAKGLFIPLFEELDAMDLSTKKVISYETDPDRRLANIRAWKYMVNTLKNRKGSPELYYARLMLCEAYRAGYKSNGFYLEPPTYEFLINMGFNRDLKLIKRRVGFKNYSLNTRLELGLPLTFNERRYRVKEKTKVNSYIVK